MLCLPLLAHLLSPGLITFLDAALPLLVLCPLVYFFSLNPLREQIAQRQQAEAALQLAYNDLELRVQERTAELVQANKTLQAEIAQRHRVAEDIRQLNESLEQRVAERTSELEASNQELEAFSYSVSHDLRAPLRHVASYTELLQKNALSRLDEKGQRYLTTIWEEAKRMGNLIDELLAFSRTGRTELHRSRVSLEALVQEALREFRKETEDRKVVWNIGPLPQVNADPQLLRLVLINLISNALKFTRSRSPARIQIGCQDEEKEVVFFIRDNGVGFDMKYAAKLFGVFERLHPMEAFEGTGIGLANVRRIIHRHGGRTWAEGAVDAGATFYFTLRKQA